MARRIDARQILVDIRSGLGEKGLMEKHGLSSPELKTVFRQIARERKTRAQAIAVDVRLGMSDAAIMKKYQLSLDGFRKILAALIAERLITEENLTSRYAGAHDILIDLRTSPRFRPMLSVTVCDLGASRKKCTLKDISTRGLAVQGIQALVGEVKRMAVLGDDLGITAPFEFGAKCRWIRTAAFEESQVAGFEITSISDADMSHLMDFIHTATEITEVES